MASENEGHEEAEEWEYTLLGGIYRVVKSIDDKVESLLDEMREYAASRSEDYFPREYGQDDGYGVY